LAEKPRVLFLCTFNSCRSQMAEGWLRHLAGERLEALSAGTHPTALHPLAVRVMAEAGVDIRGQVAAAVEERLRERPDLVIAVCSAALAGCPPLPGRTPLLSWPCDDPAQARGSEAEVLAAFRAVRDRIRERIAGWLAAGCPGLPVAVDQVPPLRSVPERRSTRAQSGSEGSSP
jgi:arsenate reductase